MSFDESFRIGNWRVQPRLNRISDHERVVQIEPKMMEVLLRLAEEPGQVVKRSQLLDTVWGDTVVGEEVLSRAVSELRKVFGDDARNPSVIETIRKSGYRLIASVDFETTRGDRLPDVSVAGGDDSGGFSGSAADAARPGAPTIASAASARDSKRRSAVIAGMAMTMLVLVVATYVIATHVIASGPSTPSRVALRTVPATTLRGTEFHPSLSPDGERLAFIWTGSDNGHLDLYVKTLASETVLQHTEGPFYEFSPSWSPDGTEIAFGRFGTGIFVVPALGGPERKLVEVESTARPQVDWSPTGGVIAYTDREAPDRPYRLHVLSLSGGAPRVLTSPPRTYEGDSAPSFSPDGRRIAFARGSSGAADVYVTELDASVSRRLTFDAAEIAGVSWSEDGRHVVFASTRNGGSAIWRVSQAGGEPELVTSASGSDLLQPSVRAGRIVYTQTTTDANIWRLRPGDEPVAVLASTRIDANPDYSPDGERIAFVSSRSGAMELWTAAADGSEPTRLTSFDGTTVANPRWSPDGAAIAFDAGVMGQSDVYVIRPEDRRLWRVTADDAADMAPSWSRDGANIYFGSNRSGSWEIWSAPAGSGVQFDDRSIRAPREWSDQAVRVTSDGGFFALETPDGSLLITRRGEPGIVLYSADGTETIVVEDVSPGDWSNWAIVGDRIYYVNRSAKTVDVHDLTSGSTETYVELPRLPYWGRPGLAVSGAGDVLYTRVDHSTYDIMVSDWRR